MIKTYIKKIASIKPFDTLARYKSWGIKSGLAILDQAVFSGANFILSIFLANWLENKEFGKYAIGLALVTIFMQIYVSYALEPMSILGPAEYRDNLTSYLIGQVKHLFLLSIPLSVLFGIATIIFHLIGIDSNVTLVLPAIALGLPLILFLLLMRRIYYILMKPGFALFGSVIYFLGLFFMLLIAKQFSTLTAVNSILITALASFFSGLVLIWFLRRRIVSYKNISLKKIFIENWSFGKGLVISGILIGIATQSQVYFAGVISNTEDAGIVRILQIFTQPIMLTFTAFSTLIMPIIVTDFVIKDYKSVRSKIFRFTFFTLIVALVYEGLLILFGDLLNSILFGEKYLAYSNQIPIWGLTPIIWALFCGGLIAIQALKKTREMMAIAGLWAFFSLLSSFVLIPQFGVWGATFSMLNGFVVAFFCVWIFYWMAVSRTIWNLN